ncbi:hypothetical protein PGH12_00685 [Chryseobacterium wangxinyae]|uniref:hypothetical protein n=1 Tax=Chryseobacterium sp. CY350 TaxID=2997336 RepID=UPI00226DB736|nr:hypothetical protein [Chryseobacterium sp. CY350]MCY0977307.1 hypothetical protein [Chryseobacterium sp. CY350]WBZ95674.1 hypothetical protein PGH12_00685 [Chryseobacterium sp. CY350]
MGNGNLISKVAVRINSKDKYTGSGYVYLPNVESEWIYIITAKHCIYGKAFRALPDENRIKISRKIGDSDGLVSYQLTDSDSIIVKKQNKPDIVVLRVWRKSIEAVLGKFPVTYLSNFEQEELSGVFKGFPSLTNNEIPWTANVNIIAPDSEGANIHGQCSIDFNDENTSGDYNVEGFSGSGLCIEVNGKLFLIGIVSEYHEAGRRFVAGKVAPWITDQIKDMAIVSARAERVLPSENVLQHNKKAIRSLGPRYSPDINVEVPILRNFESLAATKVKSEELQQALKTVTNAYTRLLDPYSKLIKTERTHFNRKRVTLSFSDDPSVSVSGKGIIIAIGEFISYFSKAFKSERLLELDWLELAKKRRRMYDFSSRLYSMIYSNRSSNIFTATVVYEDFEKASSNLYQESEMFLGAGYGYGEQVIVLDGEPGSGKSHLLADIVTKRAIENKFTLFFLGQNFDGKNEPWNQILTQLNFSCDLQTFFNIVNEKGKIINERVLVMVDAINEGEGVVAWKSGFREFIEHIKPYPYMGLVISYRTTYRTFMFGDDNFLGIRTIHHSGFSGFEREAFASFAKHYGVPVDSIPVLTKEFGNPLFLKLLCIGLKRDTSNIRNLKKIGIDRIFRYYIEHVNREIGQGKHFKYAWHKINHVSRVLKRFTSTVVVDGERDIEYEKAFLLTEDVVHRFLGKPQFLDKLIEENIFIDSIRYTSPKELGYCVTYGYERMGDHLIATELIAGLQFPLASDWHKVGMFGKILLDRNSRIENQGLIEALSIQFPEQKQTEFFEVLPDNLRYDLSIVKGFYTSFSWRVVQVDTNKLETFTEGYIENQGLSNTSFYDEIVGMCLETDQPFNAHFLHRMLLGFSLADRDASWTIYLSDKHTNGSEDNEINAVSRLLKWGWGINDGSVYDDETITLAVTTIGWFLTSTNRSLRDISTKVLIYIFLTYQDHLLDWIEKFRSVNDPYVTQRVFAVAYGCAIKSSGERLKSIADLVYNKFFKTTEVNPDILARDYARSIIEYAVFRKVGVYERDKMRPPYKSYIETTLPSNKEISALEEEVKNGTGSEFNGATLIFNSMVTEKGRSGRMYGDFGRYVFQSGLRSWRNIDFQGLSNLAVKYIFGKLGYDVEKHGSFDRSVGYNNPRMGKKNNERIGKKYQWIAFYEILARVADNELSFNYNGPWEPYVRDIDPTFLENHEKSKNRTFIDFPDYTLWKEVPDDEWMTSPAHAFDPLSVILFKEKGNAFREWLVLEAGDSYTTSTDSKGFDFSAPYQDFYYQLRSYLVKEDSYDSIVNNLQQTNFLGRWMPEAHTIHELFNREFYWSPAFKDFLKENPEWEEIKVNGKNIGKVAPTALDFLWEEEFDNSQNNVPQFFKPSKLMFDALELEYGKKEGELVNSKGDVVCFDANVNYNSENRLIVERKTLERQLKKKGLKVFWTIMGERKIVNGSIEPHQYSGLIIFDGDMLKFLPTLPQVPEQKENHPIANNKDLEDSDDFLRQLLNSISKEQDKKRK